MRSFSTQAALLVAIGVLTSCADGPSPLPLAPTPAAVALPPAPPPPSPTSFAPPGVIAGAGDIGYCGSAGAEGTARLLDRIPGTVFTAGDNAYMSGSREEFQRCYEPSWGRHRWRTRPTAGNHEYEGGGGGAGYRDYFGGSAGLGGGFYSYSVGPWNVIALNSEVPSGAGSAQGEWLRSELSTNRSACTAAIWHRPLFSSGRNGDNPDMRDVWRTLYDFNVDLVINGHDHTYERFAPQDPNGRFDPTRGIREFIVGTGGAPLYEFPNIRANSELRAAAWGIAIFTLSAGSYQWEFVPVDGGTFRDAGMANCH